MLEQKQGKPVLLVQNLANGSLYTVPQNAFGRFYKPPCFGNAADNAQGYLPAFLSYRVVGPFNSVEVITALYFLQLGAGYPVFCGPFRVRGSFFSYYIIT